MQKTRVRKLVDSIGKTFSPIISYPWSKRSILILSLLFGFYLTNSMISFLLDKSVNTIYLSIIIILSLGSYWIASSYDPTRGFAGKIMFVVVIGIIAFVVFFTKGMDD